MVRKIYLIISFICLVIFSFLLYFQYSILYLDFDDVYNYLNKFTGIEKSQVLYASGWGTVGVFRYDPFKKIKFSLTLNGWEEFNRSSKLIERSGFRKTTFTIDPSIFSAENEVIFHPNDENISYYFSESFGRQVFCVKYSNKVDVYLY